MLRFHRSLYCTPQGRLSFSKTASGTARTRKERSTASVYATSACPQPREPRTPPARRPPSLAHTAAQSRLAHCPAASTVASKRNPRTNVHFFLFLTKSCRLCAGFNVGVAYHSNADAQPPESAIQFVAQQNPPAAIAWENDALFAILTARLRKSHRRRAKRSAIRLSDSFCP